MSSIGASSLQFPHPDVPEPGSLTEIAPGVLWLRLALPFALNHVNVYLVEDGTGWAVIDTGVCDERTKTIWKGLLKGALRKHPVTRIIGTHFHPDHIGLAGFLSERCGVELLMSQTEFFFAQTMLGHPDAIRSPSHLAFFRARGLSEDATDAMIGRGHAYLNMTSGILPSYRRLTAGDTLDIGGRRFEVVTGPGHSPEQVMLVCRDERLFFSADQVLARISPNISVWAWEPDADPLGGYLASLEALHEAVPDRALVLPGHNLPFVGLHERVADLSDHHAHRCDEMIAACAKRALSAAELVPMIFPRALDPQQIGFAFGEVLAHANYLLRRGDLLAMRGGDHSLSYAAA